MNTTFTLNVVDLHGDPTFCIDCAWCGVTMCEARLHTLIETPHRLPAALLEHARMHEAQAASAPRFACNECGEPVVIVAGRPRHDDDEIEGYHDHAAVPTEERV